MKRIFVLSLLCLTFGFSYSQYIEKTFHFSDPTIEAAGTYTLLRFKHTLNTGLTGQPALPYQAVKLILPPGYIAESIAVIPADKTDIPGFYTVYPRQASRPLSQGPSTFFYKDSELYDADIAYPERQYGHLATEFMNGFSIALTTITPVVYNPAKGELAYYKDITLRITIKKDKSADIALQNLRCSPKQLALIQSFCQNPEIIDHYAIDDSRTDDYQMLIITDETFENNFDDLIDMYFPRGIIANLATVQYINSNMTGQDSQEKIRNYIKQEYQNHGVEYILLGGDVEYVPYRGFYCYVESGSGYTDNNIPADLYYSALDGNWNDDGDNYWGEIGEDDLLPDVSVTRMSFSDTAELNNMLNKVISYQEEPVTGELDQPLLAGEHLWSDPLTWGSDYLDLLIGYQNENGYETTGIPEDDNYDTLYDRSASWNKNQLMAEINEGKSFIHHSGHANANYAMRFSMNDITNANFYAVNGTDHNFTLAYTHGCICGAFDQSDCIAEKMTKIDNFVVAGGFNSRYGWFNEGQTEGPSAHLHREFVDALYDKEKCRIGETHKISKIETSPWVNAPGQHEEGALRWCFYDCNILGDPALAIWTNEPLVLYVAYPSTIHVGDGSFTVNVSTGGTPLQGYTCVFMKEDILYGMSATDESGSATITYDPANVTLGTAKLVISGYNCLPNYYDIEIIPDEGPYVIYESDTLNDASGNNNGLADFGEDILLTLSMKNAGLVEATDVEVSIRTHDSYLIITDSTENYGSIQAGQIVTINDGFNFLVADSIPDQHIVNLEVEAAGEENWTSSFDIQLHAPVLAIGAMTINDQSGGNGNGILDPGETVEISIASMNNGHCACFNATGNLTTSSPYLQIEEAVYPIGDFLAGDTLDALFTLTIDETAPIGESVDLYYLLLSSVYAANMTFYPTIGLVMEDYETGNFNKFDWQFSGDAPWLINTGNPYEGNYCSKSGNIGNSSASEMHITFNVISEGELSFYRKVSSEVDYDFLRFYIDEGLQDEWSGEQSWEKATYVVSEGEHTFKWAYEKDVFLSSGSDCAWVDYIVFPPVSLVTGIPEFVEPDLLIYPNPASDFLNISFTLKYPEYISLALYNIQGKVISKQKQYNLPAGTHIKQIDVGHLGPGIYYLSFAVEGKQIFFEKVIITK